MFSCIYCTVAAHAILVEPTFKCDLKPFLVRAWLPQVSVVVLVAIVLVLLL